jgi:hypothetical protein
MDIVTVAPQVPRTDKDLPLIVPVGGGRPVAYGRWSSYGDVLEDRYNLERWKTRMAALGIADRPDLLLAVAAHRDDKNKLNAICQQAIEAARASAAATTGTALHALSELVDAGKPLPVLPDSAVADLEAYRTVMTQVEVLAAEQFVVNDEYRVAGTFDRIVKVGGTRFIADIKTGTIEWGIGKIAIQLAGYSRSQGYNPATGLRTPLDVDQNNALIIHLPQGQAKCELVWVNIARGWEGVQLAAEVRRWRAAERKGLTAPFVPASAA